MPITIVCLRCGKKVNRLPYQKDIAKFCSRECRKSRVTLTCLYCSKPYEVITARRDISKFCSRLCQNTYQSHHFKTSVIEQRSQKLKQKAALMSSEERKRRWGHPPILSKVAREKISLSKIGEANPMKRPEVAEKVSKTLREKYGVFFSNQMKAAHLAGKIRYVPPSLEARKQYSIRMQKDNPMFNQKTREQVSQTFKQKYADMDYKKARLSLLTRHPNKPEKYLTELCSRYKLPFEYVGDSSFWIGPCVSGSCRNPDFIHRQHNLKKAILVNGDFWHPQNKLQIELNDYANAGYDILTLSDTEVYNELEVISKINTFLGGILCTGQK